LGEGTIGDDGDDRRLTWSRKAGGKRMISVEAVQLDILTHDKPRILDGSES